MAVFPRIGQHYLPDDGYDRFGHAIAIEDDWVYYGYVVNSSGGGAGPHAVIFKLNNQANHYMEVDTCVKIQAFATDDTDFSDPYSINLQGMFISGDYLYISYYSGTPTVAKLYKSTLMPVNYGESNVCIGRLNVWGTCQECIVCNDGTGASAVFQAANDDSSNYYLDILRYTASDMSIISGNYRWQATNYRLTFGINNSNGSLFCPGTTLLTKSSTSYDVAYIYRIAQGQTDNKPTLTGTYALHIWFNGTRGTYPSSQYYSGSGNEGTIFMASFTELYFESTTSLWAVGWCPKDPISSNVGGGDIMICHITVSESAPYMTLHRAYRVHCTDPGYYASRGMGIATDDNYVYIGVGVLPHAGLGTTNLDYANKYRASMMAFRKYGGTGTEGLLDTQANMADTTMIDAIWWSNSIDKHDEYGTSDGQTGYLKVRKYGDYLYGGGWSDMYSDGGKWTGFCTKYHKDSSALTGALATLYDSYHGKIKGIDTQHRHTVQMMYNSDTGGALSGCSWFQYECIADTSLTCITGAAQTALNHVYTDIDEGTGSGEFVQRQYRLSDTESHHVVLLPTANGWYISAPNGGYDAVAKLPNSPNATASTQCSTSSGGFTDLSLTNLFDGSPKTAGFSCALATAPAAATITWDFGYNVTPAVYGLRGFTMLRLWMSAAGCARTFTVSYSSDGTTFTNVASQSTTTAPLKGWNQITWSQGCAYKRYWRITIAGETDTTITCRGLEWRHYLDSVFDQSYVYPVSSTGGYYNRCFQHMYYGLSSGFPVGTVKDIWQYTRQRSGTGGNYRSWSIYKRDSDASLMQDISTTTSSSTFVTLPCDLSSIFTLSWANIAALQSGVRVRGYSFINGYVSQQFLVVNYTPVKSAADTTGVSITTDQGSYVRGIGATAAEAPKLSQASIGGLVFDAGVLDGISGGAGAMPANTIGVSALDGLAGSEGLDVQAIISKLLNQLLTQATASSSQGDLGAQASEAVQVSDVLARTVSIFATVIEAAGSSTAASGALTIDGSASEGLHTTDTAGRSLVVSPLAADGIQAGDTVTRQTDAAGNVTQAMDLSDVLQTIGTFGITAAQGLGLATYSSSGNIWNEPLTASITLAESLATMGILVALASEAPAITDTPAGQGILGAQTSDTIHASDATARSLTIIREALAGTVIGDAPVRSLVLAMTLAEILGLTDTAAVGEPKFEGVTDGLVMYESVTQALSRFGVALDGVSISDGAMFLVEINVSATDGLSFSETVARVTDLMATVQEALGLADQAITFNFDKGRLVIALSSSRISLRFIIAKDTIGINMAKETIRIEKK